MAKVFSQTYEVDYHGTFAPVAKSWVSSWTVRCYKCISSYRH